MPPKNAKLTDLWGEENGTKAVTRPQPTKTSKSWTLPPEALPVDPLAPRRRKVEHVLPNKREAVAVPLAGQSYNPTFDDHQDVMELAVKKLEKKKKEHEKLVRLLSLGKDAVIKGNFSADKTWEEEVQEQKPEKVKKAGDTTDAKKKKKKKGGRKAAADAAKKALPHRRHPARDAALKQLEDIDEIVESVNKKTEKRLRTAAKKKVARKEGQQIKNFGRYHHTPLVVDVASSEKLVGSLRHVSGSYVHPALDRIKSLEERNIIPARMRHTFNKRRLLKPKGEVRLKTESFGIMPETSH